MSQGSSLGRIYVVSSFRFSCANNIVCLRSRAPVSGAYSFPYELVGTCESHFTVTALLLSALYASHSLAFHSAPVTRPRRNQRRVLQVRENDEGQFPPPPLGGHA
jgi:hypothetical protein